MTINTLNTFSTQPREILEEIFSYLDRQSLGRVERVCKIWSQQTEKGWKELSLSRWPDEKKAENLSWKEHYRELEKRIRMHYDLPIRPHDFPKTRMDFPQKYRD